MSAVKTNIPWDASCGKRLKQRRMACGLSQGQLCQEARIPGIRILAQFECGSNSPKQDRFEAICRALGVEASEILNPPQEITVEAVEAVDSEQDDPGAVSESTDAAQTAPVLFPGNSVGERLRFIREKNNLSRSFVAEFISVSGAMVGRYENGLNMISEKGLKTFAELYSCDVMELVTPNELEAIRQHDADPMVIRNRGNQAAAAGHGKKKKRVSKAQKKKPAGFKKEGVQKPQKPHDSGNGEASRSPVKASGGSAQTPPLKKESSLPKVEAEQNPEPKPASSNEVQTVSVPEGFISIPEKDPLFPDGEPEIEKIEGNALELMLLIRKKRQEKGISEAAIATAAGMDPEEYLEYEKAQRDITISQFSFIAKTLMIAPFALIRDSFRKEWITFWGEGPKETCAAVGACVVNALPYRYKDGDGFVHIYGDSENLKLIFRNLHISGRFA